MDLGISHTSRAAYPRSSAWGPFPRGYAARV